MRAFKKRENLIFVFKSLLKQHLQKSTGFSARRICIGRITIINNPMTTVIGEAPVSAITIRDLDF
jgi:hypothetical protein